MMVVVCWNFVFQCKALVLDGDDQIELAFKPIAEDIATGLEV